MTAPAARPARKPTESKRPRQAALVAVGLGVASAVARDARTHEAVIVVAIIVAVAAAVARETGGKSLARLGAWDKRQTERAVHKLESVTKATVKAVQPGTD